MVQRTTRPDAALGKGPETEPEGSALAAAFRLENLAGSYLSQTFTPGEIDYDYDPFEDIQGTPYERKPELFADVFSRKEFEQRVHDLEREQRDRETLARAGGEGLFYAVAAGTLDPTVFLPGALPFRAAKGGAALYRGVTAADDVARGMSKMSALRDVARMNDVGRMATNVSAGAALGATVQEIGLGETQNLRTFGEQVAGVTTAAVLGGILGATAGKLSKGAKESMAQELYSSTALPGMHKIDMNKGASINEGVGVFIGDEHAAGAKSSTESTFRLKDEKAVRRGSTVTGFKNVSNLLWNQLMDSPKVRENTAKLSQGGLMKQDAENFISATSEGTVESNVKMHRRKLADGYVSMDSSFVKYYSNGTMADTAMNRVRVKAASGIQSMSERWGGSPSNRMSYKQFRTEVGKAMARGDRHEIPEVAEAAKGIRDKVIRPMKEEMQKLGILPENLDDNYLMRLYNRDAIISRKGEFKSILVENFKRNQDQFQAEQTKINTRLEKLEQDQADLNAQKKAITGEGSRAKKKPLEEKAEKLRDEINKVKEYRKANYLDKDSLDIDSLAEQVIENILGNQTRAPGIDIIAEKRGPMKARVLNVDDLFTMDYTDAAGVKKAIAFEDFLNRDIEDVMNVYVRTTASDVELHRAFDGDVTLQKRVIPEIIEEKEARLAKLDAIPNAAEREAARTKMEADYNRAIRNLEAFVDRIRGTYLLPDNPDALPHRLERIALNLNYLRLLGGMTISAIPDIFRHVMVNGWGQTYKGVDLAIKDISSWKLAAQEVKNLGVGLDIIVDSRTKVVADLLEDYQGGGAIPEHASATQKLFAYTERTIQGAANNFGMVSLMAPWNAMQKQLAGINTIDAIMRAAKALDEGKITQEQISRLANAGIDEQAARNIWREFSKEGGGSEVNGVMLTNTDAWDAKTRRVFGSAIVQEVDRTIVTPGLERPNFMSASYGRILGQFKSFGMSSVNQTLIAGLQKRDANFMTGVAASIFAGMAAAKIKAMVAERSTDHWTKEKWLAEGIDRSGVLGIFSDVNNIVEKATRGHVGIAAITGEQASRYQSRNLLGSLLGPTGGLVEDALTLPGSLAAGDWRQSDTRRLRQLLPYQNLFYFRNTLNQMEMAFNRQMGIEIRENQ